VLSLFESMLSEFEFFVFSIKVLAVVFFMYLQHAHSHCWHLITCCQRRLLPVLTVVPLLCQDYA